MSKTLLNLACGVMVIISLLIQTERVSATDFTVGGAKGWDFGIAGWENGKSFKAGDVLVFNYRRGVHTVDVVSKINYDSCNPTGSVSFSSGSDRLTLRRGMNYFICSVGSHCSAGGMKIAVYAA